MKHNIEWMICSSCGAHLYPPIEVSEIGVRDYEEAFEAPPIEPTVVPTAEGLAEINRARRELNLSEFRSVDEWIDYYRDWAKAFREEVRRQALTRRDELAGKLEDLSVIEEAEAFKTKGKRWEAVYEETPTGWRLKCPRCGALTLTFTV